MILVYSRVGKGGCTQSGGREKGKTKRKGPLEPFFCWNSIHAVVSHLVDWGGRRATEVDAEAREGEQDDEPQRTQAGGRRAIGAFGVGSRLGHNVSVRRAADSGASEHFLPLCCVWIERFSERRSQ